MIRLTLLLCVALYLGFLLLPAADPAAPEADAPVSGRVLGPVEAPEELVLDTGETWVIDRVITPDAAPEPVPDPAPEAPLPEPEVAEDAAPEPAPDIVEAPEAPAIDPGAQVLFVTGDRVNLRAGPSTEFDIVTALTLGTATEVIAEAPDGWFEIQDRSSGLTGFMSGDFLSPVAP